MVMGAMASFWAAGARAELIPASRVTDWTPGVNTGVPGGIPTNRTRIIDVTLPPYNADPTGSSDCRGAFGLALAASAEGDVIYFPAGRYRFDGSWGTGIRQHNRTIRGAGMDVTFFDNRSNSGPGINIGTGSSFNSPATNNVITAGLSKGSTQITVGSTAEFDVGQLIKIDFENETDNARISAGATPIVSVSSFPNVRRQMVRIMGKTSTTLTIFPAIYHAPSPGRSATITHSIFYTYGMGLEDFTILNENSTSVFSIQFQDCIGSWIKNVKSLNTSNYHVSLSNCLLSEVRGCHLADRKSGGSNGAGLLVNTTSGCLFEDNIVENVFPCIEVNHGSSGNVFAYNVFDKSGMNINHGPHNSHNLYEGNITPWIQSDGYFGGASEDTIYRNWLTGKYYDQNVFTAIVSLNRFARNFSIVGNVVGVPNWPHGDDPYSFGNPNMGNSSYEGTSQMSAGRFPADWKMTAVLTKRNSDTAGIVSLNSGTLRVGQFRAYLNGLEMVISNVSSRVVTFTITAGSLPAEGATVSIVAGIQGFQDLDLDVAATTVLKGNYHMFGSTGPRIAQSLGSDALPASLFRSSKPGFFADDQPWPPFDPLRTPSPNPSYDSIPAGRRFVNHTVPPPGGGSVSTSPYKPTSVRIIRQ